MKFTTQVQVEPTRKLVEFRLIVDDGIYLVWEYPDGTKRTVDTGEPIGDPLVDALRERCIEKHDPLPGGEFTGKRIRVKEGGRKTPLSDNDDLFDCDAECYRGCDGSDVWAICVLGIEAGTMGTVGGILTENNQQFWEVIWDDGHLTNSDFSEARGFYPLDQILAGAEVIG